MADEHHHPDTVERADHLHDFKAMGNIGSGRFFERCGCGEEREGWETNG